ncbi:hypothetical protein BGZ73_008423 [Actinomortierella ambigua]|nr:hypothetical protein BGZ73_008423 [Actinomortierella ambigua]
MRPLLSPSLIAVALDVTLFTTLSTSSAQDASLASSNLKCKCLPDQACWPKESDWNSFNASVGHRLIKTVPVASESHAPKYNEARCREIVQDYNYDKWRSLQPGAVMSANWETFRGKGCLLNQTTPCMQGAVPLYRQGDER